MRITNYSIATGRDQIDLEDKVEDYILEGWQPLGGIAVVITPLVKELYQAMVKDEYEKVGKTRDIKRSRSTGKK